MSNANGQGLGTAPVFFTAIATILGAILFLRFGFAVGTLGFYGTVIIVLVGHLVTIPTALAISEIATNQKVEGGGEYFIISRSFGLNIGATIGIALYLSQAISVAFYIIAFTETFAPLFEWVNTTFSINLPRQVISVPAMLVLSVLILSKGANLGIKALYAVVAVLIVSLLAFFLGGTESGDGFVSSAYEESTMGFFAVFAIIFPAFTGMTAGVGLSGDLKEPGRSIPRGTMWATLTGVVLYIFIAWKLAAYADRTDLLNDQLVMSQIAWFGVFLIPLGLAASTISSALGSIMVAPRTLQALGGDDAFPMKSLNKKLSAGKGEANEPYNATIATCAIAMIFVLLGDVNAVATVITMFFMVTYGSICLISFLYHFGGDPSYRPTFKSRWYISLLGCLMCLFLMFRINTPYAVISLIGMTGIYLTISYFNKDRGGLESIFRGAIFQMNRGLQIFLQKSELNAKQESWRPSVVCVGTQPLEENKAFHLLSWLSARYGFGSYFHLIKGYYSRQTHKEAEETRKQFILSTEQLKSNVYIDTLISPSLTSAIAQVIQLPSISGKENNMIVFEFQRGNAEEVSEILQNFSIASAGGLDICILSSVHGKSSTKGGIHLWIDQHDDMNRGLMILMSYIILSHPDWSGQEIKLFGSYRQGEEAWGEELKDQVKNGRLPISERNISILKQAEDQQLKSMICESSKSAALTIIGFVPEQLKNKKESFFDGFDEHGDILFVTSSHDKVI